MNSYSNEYDYYKQHSDKQNNPLSLCQLIVIMISAFQSYQFLFNIK